MIILSGDNHTWNTQIKDPFTSLHKIKENLPHWVELKILWNGAFVAKHTVKCFSNLYCETYVRTMCQVEYTYHKCIWTVFKIIIKIMYRKCPCKRYIPSDAEHGSNPAIFVTFSPTKSVLNIIDEKHTTFIFKTHLILSTAYLIQNLCTHYSNFILHYKIISNVFVTIRASAHNIM